MNTARRAVEWIEQAPLPDAIIRAGIRRLLRQRLNALHVGDAEKAGALVEGFIAQMNRAPIALVPDTANEQHYEVPADFFGYALGTHRKYSSCYWPAGVTPPR